MILGIDIGGTAVKMGLVDETGKLSINNMVYRLDYWGSDRSTALCEDVLKILREA